MKEYIKLAWRNIWRNKRRTLITIASVFFALLFALVMRSMQIGSYAHWTNSIVETITGFIQIHQQGYWDDKTIDNTFAYNDSLIEKINSIENIKAIIPRLESFALASYKAQTKGILLVGIDPEKEKSLSDPEKNLVKGSYLPTRKAGQQSSLPGILISERLADFLKIDVNDTLTLLSQGYHGVTAAGIYPVKGIIKLPNPELDRRIIYMDLKTCQEFYAADNRLTSFTLNLYKPKALNKTVKNIKQLINGNEYEVMSWRELNPEIVQQIESDQQSGFIMLILLYLIVGFGVLGTLLMMTAERKREFGVMVAIGLQKTKLGIILTLEMCMLGIVGILSGIAGSIPIIVYFMHHPIEFTNEYAEIFESYGMEPIMPFAIESHFFIGQSAIVSIIFLLSIIYPVYSVTKLKEANALRT